MTSLETRRTWCYAKADVQGLMKALAKLDWKTIVADSPNLDIAWEAWKNTFLSKASEYIPSKKLKKPKPKLPWMSPTLEEEIKKKHQLFRN